MTPSSIKTSMESEYLVVDIDFVFRQNYEGSKIYVLQSYTDEIG